MKKVLFVILALAVATTCFAQLQSGPSNVVGYVKVSVGSGTPVAPFYQKFGLPFKFWVVPVSGIPTYGTPSTAPSDICGDQTNCGTAGSADIIWRQDNNNQGFRLCTGTWAGTLQSAAGMGPGRAYWYVNKSGIARNLVLAGQVDNQSDAQQDIPAITMTQGAYTPYSWRDSRRDSVKWVGLMAAGFLGGNAGTSDLVWDQNTNATAFVTATGTWLGTLQVLEPGNAYWVVNRTHANGSWVYDYDNYYAGNQHGPASIDLPRDLTGGSTSKVGVSKAKAETRSARE